MLKSKKNFWSRDLITHILSFDVMMSILVLQWCLFYIDCFFITVSYSNKEPSPNGLEDTIVIQVATYKPQISLKTNSN